MHPIISFALCIIALYCVGKMWLWLANDLSHFGKTLEERCFIYFTLAYLVPSFAIASILICVILEMLGL